MRGLMTASKEKSTLSLNFADPFLSRCWIPLNFEVSVHPEFHTLVWERGADITPFTISN
jgi:hypothetical protein